MCVMCSKLADALSRSIALGKQFRSLSARRVEYYERRLAAQHALIETLTRRLDNGNG